MVRKRYRLGVELLQLADIVGVAHFIVAHLVIGMGEFIHLPVKGGTEYPGVAMVLEHLDLPVYTLLHGQGWEVTDDLVLNAVLAEIVILLSSLLYGGLVYVSIKLIIFMFAED